MSVTYFILPAKAQLSAHMKIAILANDKPSFIKPLSIGLKNMLERLDVQCDIFYNGLDLLESVKPQTTYCTLDRIKAKASYYLKGRRVDSFLKLTECLSNYDCIVVCLNVPASYAVDRFCGIEMLRKYLAVPIINYDLHFIASMGSWTSQLVEPKGRAPGLERYDYNLLATDSSFYGMPDLDYNYSAIGIDMRDDILTTQKKDKVVFLVDFERKDYEKERAVVLEALKKTNSEYVQLNGVYSMQEIRTLYCGIAGYFLAFPEAFGLPIVELQLCGSYIFTPYNLWPLSHFLNKSKFEKGEGTLGKNFLVYNNSVEQLCEQIEWVKGNYNPQLVLEQFKTEYPTYYSGDTEQLKAFLAKLESGEINHLSHLKNKALNQPVYQYYLDNK
jgi:hypothetical protein